MRKFIVNLEIALGFRFMVVACCCGHNKYPMTIIIRRHRDSSNDEYYDLISGTTIPRTRNFYKKDKDGYYYIPEIIEKRCSVCGKIATKEIQVIWKGKEKYSPRCKEHIIKGYKGKIREVTN